MSNIRAPKRSQINLQPDAVPAKIKEVLATKGYIVVHVDSIPSGKDYSRTANKSISYRLRLDELFLLEGIGALLPTTDPGKPGSLWNDNGLIRISP